MTPERRKDRRFAIDSDDIQVSVISSQRTYFIKDISKSGLAIEYSPVTDESLESGSIDILAMDYDRFYLPKISCQAVYDIPTLMEGKSFTGGAMRIRGLKFVDLIKEQKDKLNILLERLV